MDKFKVLEIKKCFSSNEKRADELRDQLKEKKVVFIKRCPLRVQGRPQRLPEPLKL